MLAARPAIDAVKQSGYDASISVPIYLGDALQLRFQAGEMFAGEAITIQVDRRRDEAQETAFGDGIEALELVFPMSLVDRANDFDSLMADIAAYIENEEDPNLALNDNHVDDPAERETLAGTIATLQRLHAQGRDHIWAYYTRNLVRPVALARRKVDVIIGNPPWLNYNRTASILRAELERQSKDRYGIWQGGRYATHQDVAGLFFTRSMDLYLKDGGVIGMVMPHSALQTGQYAKWRTGDWRARRSGGALAADFTFKTAWDLERLSPNTFFPVPASVVFAQRAGVASPARRLAGSVQRWLGQAGAADVRRESAAITDTSVAGESPYANYTREGATIVPRCLFFVQEAENPTIIPAGQTITVNPRRGTFDKDPWRGLDLTAITGQTIESRHVFDAHLGETLAPYATLEPLKAVLPLKVGDTQLPADSNGIGGIRLNGLERRMRERWRTISRLWDAHRQPINTLDLLGRLDYHHELLAQVEWQDQPGERPIRVAYNQSGTPTAAILYDNEAIFDYTLFWTCCKNMREANYLLGIINSDALATAVNKYTTANWAGNTRHLHKHLWKLPIPEFDLGNSLHAAISEAGERAAEGAARQLEQLRQERDRLTVTVARRELRKWLRESEEGAAVESLVARLLEARPGHGQ